MTVYNHPTIREPRLTKGVGLNTHLCYIMERNKKNFRFLLFFLTNVSINEGLQTHWKG